MTFPRSNGICVGFKDQVQSSVYITGDPVWCEGMEEPVERFDRRKIGAPFASLTGQPE